MHKSPKPVRKCHKCKLNLIDRCGLFDDPHRQWEHSACKGYLNEALYQQYLQEQAHRRSDPAKAGRRAHAKALSSHHPIDRTQHPPDFRPGALPSGRR